jgi:hypothetical protein
LRGPDRVSERGFTKLAGIKELRDGRVILVDDLERTVLLLDSELAEATQVGRSGSGPGEYLFPSRLLSLVGDSCAVLDDPNHRLLVLTPEGTAGGVVNLVPAFPRPEASDGQGRLYRAARVGDVQAVIRWNPSSASLDTVAHFPLPEDAPPADAAVRLSDLIPFPMSRAWTVAPDGTIAIVHPDPYQVEVIDPDGTTHNGGIADVDRLEVTEGHKEQWREQMASPRPRTVVTRGGGGGNAMVRGPTFEPSTWPRYLPPFLQNAAMISDDGRLWIQRTTRAGAPQTFDIFDSDGERIEQVILPQGRRLLGFGRGTVYAVIKDEFDLEYVERYRVGG